MTQAPKSLRELTAKTDAVMAKDNKQPMHVDATDEAVADAMEKFDTIDFSTDLAENAAQTAVADTAGNMRSAAIKIANQTIKECLKIVADLNKENDADRLVIQEAQNRIRGRHRQIAGQCDNVEVAKTVVSGYGE